MSRKPETVLTSRKLNKAAREERIAARRIAKLDKAFVEFATVNSNHNICYVSVSGVVMPTIRG